MIGFLWSIDHGFFPGDFLFDRFSYRMDNRSNWIDHFQKIRTTIHSGLPLPPSLHFVDVGRHGDLLYVRRRARVCVCVCVCVCLFAYTMCQERTLCMFYTCKVQIFDQERTHSRSAVGFSLRFGFVTLENPGIDHKIMGVTLVRS